MSLREWGQPSSAVLCDVHGTSSRSEREGLGAERGEKMSGC